MKITYEIKNRKVYKIIKGNNSFGYVIIFEGKNKKECEIWLKLYKKNITKLENKVKELKEELSKAYLDIENLKTDLENQVRSK